MKEATKLFAYEHGRSMTYHCRMHLCLIHLRSHLFNYNLIKTPFCENEFCDHVAETPSHYLLKSPKFANERRVMLSEISEIVFISINLNTNIDLMQNYFCNILIQGSNTLRMETNQNIFRHVFKFIDESGRFNFQLQRCEKFTKSKVSSVWYFKDQSVILVKSLTLQFYKTAH